MALIICKNCGKQISDKARKCIHCGCSFESKKTENQSLIEENEILKQELLKEKEKNQKLIEENELLKEKISKKKEKNKKIDNVKNISKKLTIKILDFIRYCVAIFCVFGGFAFLFSKKWYMGIAYLIMGVPFFPFLYKKIWEHTKITDRNKITLQVIIIILGIILGSCIMSIGVD